MIAVTDDWHHRIVVIDPKTKRIVWQYGHFGIASSAPGYLSKPDGLDLLPAPQTAVHHAHVGPKRRAAPHVRVRRVGSLPQAASRMTATALPDGRVVAAGGLVSGSSSTQILAGPPAALRTAGTLPAPTHDAAAAAVGGYVYVFGGGSSSSTDRISRIDTRTWRSSRAGSIGEPLSDLGAAVVRGSGYLVGGYTGTRFATAILRFRPGNGLPVAARLPHGLRYAGVAAIGRTIYVAGGLTTGGESRSVYAVDTSGRTVRRIARLPQPLAHAPMAAARGKLYLIGGTSSAGAPSTAILSIDPSSGQVRRSGKLPRPLADATAVSVGGSVYVLGGAGDSPSRAVLRLTP
jgi:outer membrane protein assembly factor BamB